MEDQPAYGDQQPENKPWHEGLTDKQRRFVEEYCKDSNATQAAVRAGYSVASARQQGHRMLTNVDILAGVRQKMAELTISSEQAAKHLSDIAVTRLNDYMVIEEVEERPLIKKHLQEIINGILDEIDFEEEFMSLVEDASEKEVKSHEAKIREWNRDILRLQLELKRNPDAFREVPGPPVKVERMQLDLVALAKAEELGNVKKLSFSEFGPKIEMYAADAALKTILEYHGKIKPPDAGTNITIQIVQPKE
jgi:phage terminase small subunit